MMHVVYADVVYRTADGSDGEHKGRPQEAPPREGGDNSATVTCRDA